MKFSKNVILGNGRFPTHEIPLSILQKAECIICCDGAADILIESGITPSIIIGDMDSINETTKETFSDIIIPNFNQETNDQTKAIEWAISQNITEVVILGATGLREDHTIGNISLLARYVKDIQVQMVSNYGIFTPILSSHTFESYKGQKVSIFSLTPQVEITSENLQYSLQNLQLQSWWMGTLNKSIGETFTLDFDSGEMIVFQEF